MNRNNNSRKRKTDLKTLVEVIFIILDAATLGTIFVFIGHDAGGPLECTSTNGLCKHDTTSLGVWKNFPSQACCLDSNELMFNTSYRGLLINPIGSLGVRVGLSVTCITPSNTVGAQLQLQYANFSSTTNLNTSNFANIGSPVFVDNSANNPCPGNLAEYATGTLPSINTIPVVFQLRVMGSGGGGSGDNPRFSSVNVYVSQPIERAFVPIATAITTVHFLWNVYVTLPPVTSTTVTLRWIATNQTTICGAGDSCIQSGSATCTVNPGTNTCTATQTVTFSTAFTGTVEVTDITSNAGTNTVVPAGVISLLQAQTLTV